MDSAPTKAEIKGLASEFGVTLSEKDLDDYHTLVTKLVEGLQPLRDAQTPTPPLNQPSQTERPPAQEPDADPYNAWLFTTEVEGATCGKLEGNTVGLKDNIALAGYPFTAGTDILKGFTPDVDAPIVTRLLEAGATIIGKHNMEYLSNSGAGDSSAFGPVRNPHNTRYLAGGSSSGGAAAVANEDCDIAIGGDQGGSIRTPAAWCGVVGVKPTRGLVPFTGALGVEHTTDTLGPITRDVETAAQTLQVIAGVAESPVPADPRQYQNIQPDDYTTGLENGVKGLTIGVLTEGFGWDNSNSHVDELVREAVNEFAEWGATITEVSVPGHRLTPALLSVVVMQGGTRTLLSDGLGTNHTGWYWSKLGRALREALQNAPEQVSPTILTWLFSATYLSNEFGIDLYSKAKNIVYKLACEYENIFQECDALVMPTVPMLPYKLDPEISRVERVKRALRPGMNTGVFNHTGHPAVTVPCGFVNGLPVGMMVVGQHFNEATLFQISSFVERRINGVGD